MEENEIQKKIADLIFLIKTEAADENEEKQNNAYDSDSFLKDINSILFIDLIVSIEKTFNIEIPDDYMEFDLLNSVEKLGVVVERCMVK